MFSEDSGAEGGQSALLLPHSVSFRSDGAHVFAGKKFFDFCASVLLIAALLPLLLSIAVLIKLDSEGPVFYRQKRHGLNGVAFEIFKFRTMRCHSGRFVQCAKGDLRVTRFGRFLRKFSVDELPQLFNVMRGEMSLIGPRPHAIEHDNELVRVLPRFMERYRTIPGITGLAQVRGLRGPTSDIDLVKARFDADLEYVRNRSGRLDLKIMMLTIPAVLSSLNAH